MLEPGHRTKLIPCHVAGPGTPCELFVVEGDSASLSVANARDASFQAVLPMRGKPLNALRASAAKVAGYEFYAELIRAIGGGFGDAFDFAQANYERVLVLTDPDADGIHCNVLLLMFFFRWMRPLLDAGRVHAIRPPLAEIKRSGEAAPVLAFSEAHFQALCKALRERNENDFVSIRYRGLGSIGRDVLATTCIEPATRKAQPLSARDAEMAIEVFGGSRPSTFNSGRSTT
jgi:DNA gyrase subunit B